MSLSQLEVRPRAGEPGIGDGHNVGMEETGSAARMRELVGELFIDLQLLAYADSPGRAAKSKELQARIVALANCPAPEGLRHLQRQAVALGRYLQALGQHQEEIGDSQLRIIGSAADVLEALSRGMGVAGEGRSSDFSVVMLDAEEGSRAEASNGLLNAGFDVVSFGTPEQTLEYLEAGKADLVVLNVPVPVPSGFDISRKIRGLGLQEKTPVLVNLLTPRATPEAQGVFVAELVLKSLNLVHRSRFSAGAEPGNAGTPTGAVEAPVSWPVAEESGVAAHAPDDTGETDETTLYLQQTGAIVAAQPSTEEMFGWEPDELVGMPVASLFSPGWEAAVAGHLDVYGAVREESTACLHLMARRKEGSEFPVWATLRRLGSDGAFQWSVGFRKANTVPAAPVCPAPSGTRDVMVLKVRDDEEGSGPVLLGGSVEAQVAGGPGAEVPPQGDEELRRAVEASEARQRELERLVAEAQEKARAAGRQAEEAERKASAAAAELEDAKAELERRFAEQERLQCEWMGRLNALKAAFAQAESATRQRDTRGQELEAATADLTRRLEEAMARLGESRDEAAAALRRVAELEAGLSGAAKESAELNRRMAEAESARQKAEAESRSRSREKDELAADLGRLLESRRPTEQRLTDLERQLRDGVAAQARLTRELEQERGERRRAEERMREAREQVRQLHEELGRQLSAERELRGRMAELERALGEEKQAASRAQAEMEQHQAKRQVVEAQLREMGQLSEQYATHVARGEEAWSAMRQVRDEVERALGETRKKLGEVEAERNGEHRERCRVESALAAAERRCEELTVAQAADRERYEQTLARQEREQQSLRKEWLEARQEAIRLAGEKGLRASELGTRLRGPAEALRTAAARLLDLELPDAQKALLEDVLEQALVLEEALRPEGEGPAPAA